MTPKTYTISTLIQLALAFTVTFQNASAQGVGINASGSAPDPSSILDVSSPTQGMLIPRLSSAQRDAMVAPAEGLHIYNTSTHCDNFFNGTNWVEVCGACIPAVSFPATVSGSGATQTGFDIIWTAVPNATAYQLDVSLASNFSSFIAGYNSFAAGNSTSHTLTGLVSGTTYYMRVRAVGPCGPGASSVPVSFSTLSPPCYSIGDTGPAGGIVFWVDPGSCAHGLEAAPSDAGSYLWYNGVSFMITGSSGTAIGTGQSNTNLIVAAQGSGSYAAKVCSDLVSGGYDDWFLPSKDELYQLYVYRNVIGQFVADNYWSSSEFPGLPLYYSYRLYFPTVVNNEAGKDETYRVRPIRYF